MAAIGSDMIPVYIDSNGRPQPTKEFALKSHKHTKSDITDFAHTHTKSQITDFAHTHVIGDVTGLQSALDLKAPLASPTFTGTPKAPTPTESSDGKQVVNKEYLLEALSNIKNVKFASSEVQTVTLKAGINHIHCKLPRIDGYAPVGVITRDVTPVGGYPSSKFDFSILDQHISTYPEDTSFHSIYISVFSRLTEDFEVAFSGVAVYY